MRRRLLMVPGVLAAAAAIAACGKSSLGTDVQGSAGVEHGARLFAERCSGCHSLEAVGAEGSTQDIGDSERVDGPNFNVRNESVDSILYAIRNGGYSGAIMPENIVVGRDARDVAEFLSQYSGRNPAKKTPASQDEQDGG